MKRQLGRQLVDELKQKQAITFSLINKILYSKRLLVDHVQALEEFMRNNEQKQNNAADEIDGALNQKLIWSEIFTARNTCIALGSTILEHFITPRFLRFTLVPSVLITSGFSALYTIKYLFGVRNKIVETELENLVRTIDDFGNCIRRNMTYFNEIIVMKQQELIESRQIERAWDCITAAKEVTEILFEATRKLESQYPLPSRFSQYYAPLEDLKNCEFFENNVTDYSPRHIKDFHNIFAYVQSQFLLRLALTLYTKPSLSQLNRELVKIENLIRQLALEEENHFKNLTIELNKAKCLELQSLNEDKTVKTRNDPIGILQDSSLKLSARMVAVAAECQALDITLQRLNQIETESKDSAKSLVQVANNMHSIESALSICFDDFQRLILVYNRFLTNKLELNDGKRKQDEAPQTSSEEFPDSFLRVEISEYPSDTEKKDDFYAYIFDAERNENEGKKEREEREKLSHDLEILNFEKRVTRGKFRPVLKQLKERINPIRQVMLEKEREVLAAKGIKISELFPNELTKDKQISEESGNTTGDEDFASDSEGLADLEYKKRSRKVKEHDNFEESRNFLAQKPNLNLFKLDIPPPSNILGDESILESEC
ncbi:uncharacterized protein LOC119634570 [Glossina fuscipes]|uniref:Uncharacterized protein LOC119634570 n=1 Tax=Glossina fuscipes TaxID=7396 RepID=A0A8U0WHF9_9MUSC|nr:uncharacterized protein LOC119634570 [Glossina fuscipes]KAI9584824.1 hypothetical protein GQX74_006719 [Glossina fuscipes]